MYEEFEEMPTHHNEQHLAPRSLTEATAVHKTDIYYAWRKKNILTLNSKRKYSSLTDDNYWYACIGADMNSS